MNIAPTASIIGSVVGPYVTVGDRVRISDSVVRDAIIESGSTLEAVALERSLVGRNATLKGTLGQLNVGDDDEIVL